EESRERLSGAGAVAGAIQRDGEEIARAAFRGKQLDGLAQRRNRRGLVVVFQKQHAQVHVGGGHSRIEPSGALVFGLRLLWLLERRVNISKLKMAVGQVRLISENLRSEEHTSELQSRFDLVCRLLLEKKNKTNRTDLVPY